MNLKEGIKKDLDKIRRLLEQTATGVEGSPDEVTREGDIIDFQAKKRERERTLHTVTVPDADEELLHKATEFVIEMIKTEGNVRRSLENVGLYGEYDPKQILWCLIEVFKATLKNHGHTIRKVTDNSIHGVHRNGNNLTVHFDYGPTVVLVYEVDGHPPVGWERLAYLI